MQNQTEVLKERMSSLNDESLIKILTVDFNDYESEALKIAKEELESRNINIDDLTKQKELQYLINQTNININEIIPLKDILGQIDFALVEEAIFNNYPEEKEFTTEYKIFFDYFLKLDPIKSKNVLIVLDEQVANIDDSEIPFLNIYGLDTELGNHLNLELFKWNEWLSFFVKINDLKRLGIENYFAHCLYKMTINGFNESDVTRNLKIKTEENNYTNFFNFTAKATMPNINNENIFKAAQEYKTKLLSTEVPQIRPWIRFWARTLDGVIVSLILVSFFKFLVPLRWNIQILGVPFSPLFLAVIESMLLSTWGTTPGKWLLQIKARNYDSNILSFEKAIRRSIMVWLIGEGLLLNNVLNIFSNSISYFKLTRTGKTFWDQKYQIDITHKNIGILRSIIFVALLIIFSLLQLKISLLK